MWCELLGNILQLQRDVIPHKKQLPRPQNETMWPMECCPERSMPRGQIVGKVPAVLNLFLLKLSQALNMVS